MIQLGCSLAIEGPRRSLLLSLPLMAKWLVNHSHMSHSTLLSFYLLLCHPTFHLATESLLCHISKHTKPLSTK